MKRAEAFRRVGLIVSESDAARIAVATTLHVLRDQPLLLHRWKIAVTEPQMNRCAAGLDEVFLIRLYAEFEAILREYWRAVRRLAAMPRTRMEVLIKQVAARTRMSRDVLLSADAVRVRRNQIVHGSATPLPASAIDFFESKKRIHRFLSFLPLTW